MTGVWSFEQWYEKEELFETANLDRIRDVVRGSCWKCLMLLNLCISWTSSLIYFAFLFSQCLALHHQKKMDYGAKTGKKRTTARIPIDNGYTQALVASKEMNVTAPTVTVTWLPRRFIVFGTPILASEWYEPSYSE